MHIRRAALALAAILVVAPLAACGDDDDATGSSADGGFPVTVDGVTIDERPERIVSLSATSTEMLFSIGAGDQVVAVDLFSNYPPEAPEGELDAYEPSLEAIADKEPDLVVASNEIDGLDTLGIPVLVLPAATTLDDTYEQLEALGLATGHEEDAAEAADAIREGIADIVDEVDGDADGLTYYYELTPDLYSATSRTFIGALLAELGFENIADEAPGGAGDYPQLSSEFVVDADPDLVILADTKCCDQDAAAVASRAGWSGLTAVKGKGVVELDDDIASRWGPRVVDLLEEVAGAAGRVVAGR